MPDDTDDQIADPAQVVAAEPRSAVEAANNPAHGGGFPADNAANNTFGERVAFVNQGVNPSLQDYSGMGSRAPKVDSPRTISSGIARFAEAYDGAVVMVEEFGDLVGEIEGDAIEAVSTAGVMVTAGTAGAIHDLAGGYDALFARMADLVKRARAAHG